MKNELHIIYDIIYQIIHQGVKEVEETWGNLKFSIHKYVKGTQERGFMIGSVEEVLQTLDDNSMQLQVGLFFLHVLFLYLDNILYIYITFPIKLS